MFINILTPVTITTLVQTHSISIDKHIVNEYRLDGDISKQMFGLSFLALFAGVGVGVDVNVNEPNQCGNHFRSPEYYFISSKKKCLHAFYFMSHHHILHLKTERESTISFYLW